MPGAGQLRERVRFERRTVVDDGAGNRRGDWVAVVVVSAKVVPVKGREEVIAGKLAGTAPREIVIRWRADLAIGPGRLTTEDCAVNAATGETYNIRSIENPDMKRIWLKLTCEIGVPS
ncbi:phage head closure protein [Acuticoccus sp. M5D2P5]|uniref:phage head closure protein n=1 Tax=Acuticoccus kalidii TaxID=2910977 RepID=UPI001F3E7385|nr:phage head closure protein [Acuticoccus kalidii]MCF3933297.1 phage head closure protein [Acuticoccus kalidii]